MKITEEGYQFESTGRFMRNHGTVQIGLDVINESMDITLGYDNWVDLTPEREDGVIMTDKEVSELCDFMIGKWSELKAAVS